MLAGVGAAIFSFIWGYFRSGYVALSTPYIMSMLVIRMISGAIISGILGKAISDSLAKTGVLSSFALGKHMRKERSVS
jgi:energy-coupling factor transport system permease protein